MASFVFLWDLGFLVLFLFVISFSFFMGDGMGDKSRKNEVIMRKVWEWVGMDDGSQGGGKGR